MVNYKDKPPEVVQGAIDWVKKLDTDATIAANAAAAARKQVDLDAKNEYVSGMIQNGVASPEMIQKAGADQRLSAESKENLVTFAKQDFGLSPPGQFGPAYTDTARRIFSDGPDRLTDSNDILKLGIAEPGGGQASLTPSGVDRLMKIYAESLKPGDKASINRTVSHLEDYAKGIMAKEQLVPGMPGTMATNKKGLDIFNGKFIPLMEGDIDRWIKGGSKGESPLTQEHVDKLIDQIYPETQRNADNVMGGEGGTATPGAAPARAPEVLPPPPQGVDAAAWGSVMADRPMSGGAPYPAADWASKIDWLRQNPTTENIKLFDESKFGTKAGLRGVDILNKLNGTTPPGVSFNEPPKVEQEAPSLRERVSGNAVWPWQSMRPTAPIEDPEVLQAMQVANNP
ncbi:MAG: hypothetical protein WA441_13385 [Methyloceanibacter sp.]